MTDAATASSRTMKGRNMVVVFFSRAGENYEVGEVTVGNTAKLAQEVARRTDSPMIEIARTEPYPERYAATSEMVQEEQRVNVRPLFTLSGDVDALDSSDTVFLGYPIWCGDMPMPVYAFLESRDWSGKTIYPFCTHGGSGLGRTPERIAAITKTTVKPGLAVMGTNAQNKASKATEAVSGWIAKSGLYIRNPHPSVPSASARLRVGADGFWFQCLPHNR